MSTSYNYTFDQNFFSIFEPSTFVSSQNARVSTVTTDSNGNIYILGSTDSSGIKSFVLAKFSSAGILDSTFGNTGPAPFNKGYFIGSFNGSSASSVYANNSLKFQNNMLYFCGGGGSGEGPDNKWTCGTSNLTGTNVTTQSNTQGSYSNVSSPCLCLNTNNDVYIGGSVGPISGNSNNSSKYMLVKLILNNGNYIIDTTFGAAGYLIDYYQPTGSFTPNKCSIKDITIDNNANIYFVGQAAMVVDSPPSGTNGVGFNIYNLNSNTYTSQIILTNFNGGSNLNINNILLGPNNSIFLVGTESSNSSPPKNYWVVQKYTRLGVKVNSFGNNGTVTGYFNDNSISFSISGVIDPTSTGTIIITGTSQGSTTPSFSIAFISCLDGSYSSNNSINKVIDNPNPYPPNLPNNYNSSIFLSSSYYSNNNLILVGISNYYLNSSPPPLDYYSKYEIFKYTNSSAPAPAPAPSPAPAPVPISNICFIKGTPIETDSGVINIEDIDTKIDKINGKNIIAITKTINSDKALICFEKDSIHKNYPNKKTIVSKNHKIYYQGKMIEAYKFLNLFKNVHKIKYNGEILYNILMETHEIIIVNNMYVETLHPNNLIAKLYNSPYDQNYKNKLICIMNDAMKKNNHTQYKKILNHM